MEHSRAHGAGLSSTALTPLAALWVLAAQISAQHSQSAMLREMHGCLLSGTPKELEQVPRSADAAGGGHTHTPLPLRVPPHPAAYLPLHFIPPSTV